jgi:hypothetical protein
MSSRFSFALLNLLTVLVAFILTPIARAEQWDKETIVTFSGPIEVPGKVLPAGTYVFKIANSQSDRQVVQIFTQDQRKVLASIQAVPDFRLHPTDKPVISFEERPSGEPEALQSWFYPGESYGVHFVYPKSPMAPAGNPDAEVAANAAPTATAPALTEAIAPPVAQLTTPPVVPVLANPEPERQVLAQNTAPKPMHALLATLPKTSGNFMTLPLIGLLLLGGGSAILNRIKQRSYHSSSF